MTLKRKKNPIGAVKSKGFIVAGFAPIYNTVVYAVNRSGERVTINKSEAMQWQSENGAAEASVKIAENWGEPAMSIPVKTSVAQIESLIGIPNSRKQSSRKQSSRKTKRKVTRKKNYVIFSTNGKTVWFLNDKLKWTGRNGKGKFITNSLPYAKRIASQLEKGNSKIGITPVTTSSDTIKKFCLGKV